MFRVIRLGSLGVAILLTGTIATAQQKGPTPTGPQGQAPVPQGQVPVPQGQAPTQPGQVPVQPGQTPVPQGQTPVQPGQANVKGPTAGMQAAPFGGISQNPWYANNAVQQHLNLSNQQNSQLNKIYSDQWTLYQKQLNALPQNLSNDQRVQQMREIRQNFYNDFNTASAGVFNPAQQQRYRQLNNQYRSYGVFEDPAVQQKLNLNQNQRQQLMQYENSWNQQLNAIRQSYATDPAAASKQFANLQQQNAQNINSILTPQQRIEWHQIIGEPFTFQPAQFFPAAPYVPVIPTGSNK